LDTESQKQRLSIVFILCL